MNITTLKFYLNISYKRKYVTFILLEMIDKNSYDIAKDSNKNILEIKDSYIKDRCTLYHKTFKTQV